MQNVLPTLMVVLLVASCASVPDFDYYTVDMAPSGGVADNASVTIAEVEVSQALVRNEILIHTSPTQIEYYATHRWAAPVRELIQDKLNVELGAQSNAVTDYEAVLAVKRFGQVDTNAGADGHAVIVATYYDMNGAPVLQTTYDARQSAEAATAPAVVEALSRCLEEIAAAMAGEDIRAPAGES